MVTLVSKNELDKKYCASCYSIVLLKIVHGFSVSQSFFYLIGCSEKKEKKQTHIHLKVTDSHNFAEFLKPAYPMVTRITTIYRKDNGITV